MNDKFDTSLQSQINSLSIDVKTINNQLNKKNYYNGRREEKIDKLLEKVKDLDDENKEKIKNLFMDQETLEEKIRENEEKLNQIITQIEELPLKVIKYMLTSIPLTAVIIEIIINTPKIIELIKMII